MKKKNNKNNNKTFITKNVYFVKVSEIRNKDNNKDFRTI